MIRRILPFVLAAFSVVGITYLLSQSTFIREGLAPFLFRLTLIIRDTILSMPDIVFWATFCVFALMVGIFHLLRLLSLWLDESDVPVQTSPLAPIGPVEKYRDWIEQTTEASFFRRQIARDLARFTFETFQHPAQSLSDYDLAIENEEISLTPEVADFLREGTARKESASNRFVNSLSRQQPLALHGIVETLELLEAELGIELPEEEAFIVEDK